jgi:hypothetical protein
MAALTLDAWICWEHDEQSHDPNFPARHPGCPIGALHHATAAHRFLPDPEGGQGE